MPKKSIFLFGIFLLYIILVLFGVFHHEPWRDEAHGWMTARENSIQTLLEETKYIGVQPLWYLVLLPWVKVGLSYTWMSIVHAAIAIAASGMLLFFARIPLITKILFIFSYYMAYEYAIVARNYVLTAVLLFAIATIYSQRFKRPLLYSIPVFLLFHVNSLSLGIAGGLVLIYFIELLREKKINTKRILALGVMAMGALLAFLILYNPYRPTTSYTLPPGDTWAMFLIVIRHSIVPEFLQTDSIILLKLAQFNSFILILSAISLIFLIVIIWEKKSVVFLAILSYGWFFYVNTIVHAGSLRHHGLILIILIFIWWISEPKRASRFYQIVLRTIFFGSFNGLLLISCIYTTYIYYQDYKYNFSGAKDMADYIKSQGLENVDTVLYEGGLGEAIMPYFKNNRFWIPEFESSGYFEMTDKRYEPKLYEIKYSGAVSKVLDKVNNKFISKKPLLLLLSSPIPDKQSRDYTLLHTSEAKYFWSNETENFWLYRRI